MKEAIEKLLKAKELGLDTYPFSTEGDKVVLNVEDTEEGKEFCVTLAEFRVDFKNKDKVYSYNNMCERDWEEPLRKVCQGQIDKYWAQIERKDKLVAELLLSLR
jgi:hypothetical protein